jgi:hypothetical protein
MHERTIAGAYVTEGSTAISPTSTLSRFTYTRTLAGGVTIAFVQPIFRANLSIGTAYDFTIRLAAPQMELGAYATSYIPTTSASVTRNADVISRGNIFTNGLVTASGGTWFVDFRNNIPLIRQANGGLTFSDSSSFNYFNFYHPSSSSRILLAKAVGGSFTNIYTTLTNTSKVAIKWNGTTADVFVNGVKVVAATSFTATSLENLLCSGTSNPFNINSMALFPTPLTDTQCIALTT